METEDSPHANDKAQFGRNLANVEYMKPVVLADTNEMQW